MERVLKPIEHVVGCVEERNVSEDWHRVVVKDAVAKVKAFQVVSDAFECDWFETMEEFEVAARENFHRRQIIFVVEDQSAKIFPLNNDG